MPGTPVDKGSWGPELSVGPGWMRYGHRTVPVLDTRRCRGRSVYDLTDLGDVLWSARTSSELVAGVEELQRLKAATAALEAQLLAEVDARGLAKTELAWGSTADWFTHCAGTTRNHGKRTVEHAQRLVAERGSTLVALWDGTVSPEQAGVIVDAVEQLPLGRRPPHPWRADAPGRGRAVERHRPAPHRTPPPPRHRPHT